MMKTKDRFKKYRALIIAIGLLISLFFIIFLFFFDKPFITPVLGEEQKEGQEENKETKLGEGVYLNLQENKIILEGKFAIVNEHQILEFLACAENSPKEHESLVILKGSPTKINLALISIGLTRKKDMKKPKYQGDPTKPEGPRVNIKLEWETENGQKKHSYFAEELIFNIRDKTSMPRVGWIYVGSEFIPEIDPDTQMPTGRKFFAAELQKIVVSTFHNPNSLLDNPLKDGGDDTLYYPMQNKLPKPGTPVKMLILKPSEKEEKQLKKNEEEFEKKLKKHKREK